MELSNVLNKLTHREPPEKEYFWALQIWDDGVKSAIWTIEEEKTKVVALGSGEFWEKTTTELVEATDRSLTRAMPNLPELEKEPSKVIFGLPYHWLDEEKIRPDRQPQLQSICEKLELQPLGFVLTVDALNHYLKEKEGIPPSTILVGPQKDQVLVCLIERGKVLSVEQVIRSENLADDVYEGLVRLKGIETWPSRILLFNGKELEDERQVLVSFPWQQKLPFLHLPRIEILPSDFDITAVCLSGGSEVAKSLGFKINEEKQEQNFQESEQPTEEEKASDASPDTMSEAPSEIVSDAAPSGVESELGFGFVLNKDVQALKKESEAVETPEVVVSPDEVVEEAGREILEEDRNESAWEPLPERKRLGLPPLPSLPRFPAAPLLGLIFFLLILGGGVFAFWWFVPEAEVVIYVAPQNLQKEFEVKVDPNQEVVDFGNLILPARAIDAEVEDQKADSATGKKTVGEKAKGEVVIFNTGSTRSLAAGTIFIGPGGKKFLLDQEATVASGSAVSREEITASITASEIGADYNLGADSVFTISNLDKSTIGAKNQEALTGGTSRQIQAVSEEDQKRLVASLLDGLKEKVKARLLENIPSDRRLVEESVAVKEVSRQFSHKVGDEAANLSLDLKVRGSALVLSRDDLLLVIEKQISDAVPAGYQAKREEITPSLIVKEQAKDGSLLFNVNVSANLLPKLEVEEVASNIKGKSPEVARDYLSRLPGYADAEIVLYPAFVAKFLTLPRFEKKIHLEFRSQ